MARTRIKICGITRPQDAQAAVDAGADAIGLVFYAASPRAVQMEQAREIIDRLPAMVTSVGLFVDADPGWVAEIAAELSLGLLQFHGDETPDDCAAHRQPWMKALRVRPGLDVGAEMRRYSGGTAVLLDAYKQGVPGGTGERFDWSLIPGQSPVPIVLAGGLDAGNVGEAISRCTPFAVDVSGGVEASPDIKSADRIYEFVAAVQRADAAQEVALAE